MSKQEKYIAHLITGGIENRIDSIKVLTTQHEPVLGNAPERARDMVINGNRKYKGKYN
jgi:hypothetical protein